MKFRNQEFNIFQVQQVLTTVPGVVETSTETPVSVQVEDTLDTTDLP